MKIHTDRITREDMYRVLPNGVSFYRLNDCGSRSRDHAFDFILEGTSGRMMNFGNNGQAATWDEWGIFLARLFAIDPNAHTGKHGYKDYADFHWQTGHRYRHLKEEDQHKNHKWKYNGIPFENTCKCGAVRRWEPHVRMYG
jgi:hypothetical protein